MNKIYGYCRISTSRQNIERQIRNIKEVYPDALIYQEAYTGTKMDRPKFQMLLRVVKAGDTIVFDEVSRMSRTADEGFELYKELYEKGVELVFLKESHINTEVYKKAMQSQVTLTGDKIDFILQGVNQYLMELAKDQIRIAFEQAESEVEHLRRRTREGIETARQNGKQIGRIAGDTYETKKSIEAKKVIRQHSKSFGGGLSDAEVMKLAGCSRNSYYKYKRELMAENE